jgi:16S rRNA (guanine966-N2)-methyltransferase
MRVVGGILRGRRLATPAGRAIRPTSDRIRESIFDLLGVGFSCSVVWDLFAGTGAMGIEALSRGCESAVFVERDKQALELIRINLEKCGLADHCRVIGRDVMAFLKTSERETGADLVLVDPPYHKGLAAKTLESLGCNEQIEAGGRIVCETESSVELPEKAGNLKQIKQKVYGDTTITLYYRAS